MSLTFISAGAGSGKTYTLTQTLGRLLNTGSVRPAGVIATTFTKKAATELRERVRHFLLGQGEFALANAMGQARIGTVNSVCGSLLERFAFEAGMPTRQQVIEENQSTLLIREAIDAATSSSEIAELSILAERLGIEDWRQAVRELVTQARANDVDPIRLRDFAAQNAADLLAYFPAPTSRDLNASLRTEIDAILPQFRATAQTSTVRKTGDALKLLETFSRKLQRGMPAWHEWVKVGRLDPEKGLRSLVEPVVLLAQNYAAHPQLHADLRDYLQRIFAVAAAALEQYAQRKLELGAVDFTDQEHILLGLLDNPEVAAVLREELDLLLVDEFQDTSPIQLALFIKLSRLARQTYWVGDIKQAIYGFRGSDTALMQAILAALPQIGSDVGGSHKEVLSGSWRSRPPLVKLVNAIFIPAFAGTLPPKEIALSPQRPETQPTPAFANWVLAGGNVNDAAAAMAEGVRQLLASQRAIPDHHGQTRPIQARDIAILCRTNEGIRCQASALRKIGIPVATANAGLLATPEATLALACLRRLNDASDTVASAEIISLTDSTEPECWLADRLAHLASGAPIRDWRESGAEAHPLLARIGELRAELPLLTPREALQRLIAMGELPKRVLAWQQDPAVARMRIANLEALLDLAGQYEDACRGTRQASTLSGLLLWFDEQGKKEQDHQAEPSVNAVRILTHHAAKGLEWPVVILSDLDKSVSDRLWGITATSQGSITAMEPLRDRFIRYWPWPFAKLSSGILVADTITASPLSAQFSAAAIAEAQRLLYVSMTRPRELLILARKEKAKQEPWLATLGADWLAPSEPVEGVSQQWHPLTLPNGEEIPAETWYLTAPDTPAPIQRAATPLYWFPPLPAKEYLPLYTNPSASTGQAGLIVEEVAIGERIPVAGQPDWAQLGSALHACIAFSFTRHGQPAKLPNIESLLQRFEVLQHLEPAAVLRQIEAFQQWIAQRWPNARPLAETPIRSRLANGQILNGRIDLLLDTPAGYILIDHKSSPGGNTQREELAQTYSGQLAAYASAISATTGKEVREKWLFLPVAAHGLLIH